MTPLPVFYFAHGVDGNVCNGWERDWEWNVDDNFPAQGESYTYAMNSLQRGSRRQKYADILAARIRAINARPDRYASVNLVAHSEGTDIVTLALQQPGTHARHVHLMGGACDASFEKNGLNRALREGRVERVFVYVSPDDEILWGASAFWLWGPALGKAATVEDARNQMELANFWPPGNNGPVVIVFRPGFRHSDWVYDHGAETFASIMAASL